MDLLAPDLPGRILVVDDVAANRDIVEDCMTAAGHEVRAAEGAEAGFAAMNGWEPHVIISDVMMPSIDGLKFCALLKADPKTKAIPVILMTALSDRKLRLMGVQAGANDFLHKPLDTHEVVLRVRNAIRTKRLYDGMKSAHESLKQLEILRDGMIHMLVHDMRSPLMCIGLTLEAMRHDVTVGDVAHIADDVASCLGVTGTLTEMISTILDVSRLEAGAMPIEVSSCNVHAVIAEGVARVSVGSGVLVERSDGQVVAPLDKGLVARAVANLVSNAIKFSAGKPIHVRCLDSANDIEIQVDDSGPGVPIEARESIFQKFGSLGVGEAKRHATGLGLHFCKQVAVAHGGAIGVAGIEPSGTRFWLRLPKRVSPVKRI